ncbi:MAG: TRAP-type transport system small permease protein [Clostridia bacterium]|jgi:TRAP-type C4-dicarboxylate transport system permease small subunit|nr:C4-dicarboxylate transporter, small subunit [Clostridiales bacterium]MDK2985887.1 TRAP-type transport system small permease protein [Clostridia bacterium]
MEKIIRLFDRISKVFGSIAGVMMLIGVTLVLTEIVVRALFDKTLYITEEYTGYLMVAITFLGLAYTLKEKGHIRMVFLHKVLKGKARILLDIYAFIIGLAVFTLITITTFNFFWDSVVSQTRSMQISETYLAIPQSVMPLGSFIVTLQFAAELLRSILKLRAGDVEEEEVESGALGR